MTETTFVVDNGSGQVKAGMAYLPTPSIVLASVVGTPKYRSAMPWIVPNGCEFVGGQALRKQGVLNIRYPIKHGVVTDWEQMEKIWDRVYMLSGADSRSHPLLMTDAPLNPKINREKMAELAFEGFGVPSMFIEVQGVLALYAAAKTSGVVLDSGDGVTHTMPVWEGYCISHAIGRMNIAGRDIGDYLSRLLCGRGCRFSTSSEREIVRSIKESHCSVAAVPGADAGADAYQASACPKMVMYTLPDGEVVDLGDSVRTCAEALFDPSLIGRDVPGIHHMLLKTVAACDIDIRRTMVNSIVLSGGTTLIDGFPERLGNEMSLAHASHTIHAPAKRLHSVWSGGALVGSLPAFDHISLSSADYEECGPGVVHRVFK